MAACWDLLRGDTSGWPDRAFYRAIFERAGQPVLDVGCGTGRLLLDYLAEGVDVDGADISEEMLTLCRAKADGLGLRPRLYRQPMEALDLPRRYRTILVPSSSFQLVSEPGRPPRRYGASGSTWSPAACWCCPSSSSAARRSRSARRCGRKTGR